MDKFSGSEGNINFTVDPMGRNIKITVENIITKELNITDYECQYPCIFGYDAFDVNEVNRILDDMINETKTL